MIRPVKGSDLAEQIELAREEIESWPQWLKDATRIGGGESESAEGQKSLGSGPRLSDADFID